MLTVTKLANAEYLLSQVAEGIDDYYVGRGEAPGVWHGVWAAGLGLDGVVDASDLRALLDGLDPSNSMVLAVGGRERRLRAFDCTFSAPKSVSLLWAFGTPDVAAAAAIAHVEAVAAALDVLEEKAAVTRQQIGGVRSRVGSAGLAVATFVHRTSRDGDPQLHSHCVIPNLVQRTDGTCVALDATALYEWKKAVGSTYAEELRTRLTQRLGVAWGRDRNGTREMNGFTPTQLRQFSKRTVAIEAHLANLAGEHRDRASRMRADEHASLATRPPKDLTLTPEQLTERWEAEADQVGLPTAEGLTRAVCGRPPRPVTASAEVLFAGLVDDETGLCATRSRFGHAHVVEAVAAAGGGTLTARQILDLAEQFLASELVVRLVEPSIDGKPTPARWTTRAHLALEHQVMGRLDRLEHTTVPGPSDQIVDRVLDRAGHLGGDQVEAVCVLNEPGPALRLLAAPAGYGKTTTLHTAAAAQLAAGRPVIAVATTNQAVAELRDVGLPAMTLARLRADLTNGGQLRPGTTVIVDEVSQVSTADAAWLLAAAAATPGVAVWLVGDAHQARPVRAGGLAAEAEARADAGAVPAAVLEVNRRQMDPAERDALGRYRAGRVDESQTIRSEHGWTHDCGTPNATRQALADHAAADIIEHGPWEVAVLAVSHADAEDLADRIRALCLQGGTLGHAFLAGPAWDTSSPARQYAAGDMVLVHSPLSCGGRRLHNGTVLAVTGITDAGLTVSDRSGHGYTLPVGFVQGRRSDGRPNLSHAWARTVDGAQGGTWTQVHLLGTAALDRYTGYVGQSRSRQPTHTWAVTRLTDVDHGGVIITPTPAEAVLAALERRPDPGFAARRDPNTLGWQLQAERAGHLRLLDQAPPFAADQLTAATRQLDQARQRHQDAAHRVDTLTHRFCEVRPLERLTRHGRQHLRDLHHQLEEASSWLTETDRQVGEAADRATSAQAAHNVRQAWEAEHGWRRQRIADIDQQFDRHWAHAVLTATRQHDPTAFGLDRLRAARRYYATKVGRVDDREPSAGRDDLAEATAAVGQLGCALAELRAQRVADAAAGHLPEHLRHALGPAPADPAGRAAWSGIVYRIETWRDHNRVDTASPGWTPGAQWLLGPRPAGVNAEHWDTTAAMSRDHRAIVEGARRLNLGDPGTTAKAWLDAADQAAALAPREPSDRGLSRDLGIEL